MPEKSIPSSSHAATRDDRSLFSKIGDTDFWEDLLDFIEAGNVMPIVGQGITTIAPDDDLIGPWLAQRLAERLGVPQHDFQGEEQDLGSVVCRHLVTGGPRQQIYTRLHRILKEECPPPGKALRELVSIDALKFFITTTVDPLLARALEEERPDESVSVCAYSPSAESKDIPDRKDRLNGSTVYHILGKSSPQSDDFVVWEDDMMEFILGLHRHMPELHNLSKDLANPKLHYLILGLNFSDWLVRFFLRAARQSRLTSARSGIDYIADDASTGLSDGLVMFFGSVERNLHIIECDPREFISELSKRWAAREREPRASKKQALQPTHGPVFISYAHEDMEAAFRLKNAMEDAGIPVWLDKIRLGNGMNYENTLKDVVTKECGYFISLISQTTEAEKEAYFHKERFWAAQRAESWSEKYRAQFYHPIVIDESIEFEEIEMEPGIFAESQLTRLTNGRTSDEFVNRFVQLLQEKRK